AGAGYARLGSPGVDAAALPATEVTGLSLPAEGWADAVLADLGRFGALVVGPGLGRSAATVAAVQRVVAGAPVPVLVDGDGLFATAGTGDVLSGVVGALLADGVDGLRAAAAGAYVHGLAGRLGPRRGLVAGDLLELLPRALSDLTIEARPGGGPRDEARPG